VVVPSPLPLRNAAEIPGYRLIEKIGEGGTGKVYRALHTDSKRTVAIKFLAVAATDPKTDASFRRESELMAKIRHPNVVAVHEWGVLDNRPYLVMEYVDGVSLRARMSNHRPFAPANALPVLDAIADALACIHSQGILHLDLKPENVLCSAGGDFKITDFGLAVPHLDARELAELGLVQGTIDYCAPEQRYGLPLDQRADLFAFAVLAYELLSGALPGRVFVPASQRNRRLHASVDAVLERGLARDKDERPASVAAWYAELRRALKRWMWRLWPW
jgi:serine/threonine protein kinase